MSAMAGVGAGVRPFKYWVRKAALREVNNKHVQYVDKWHIVQGDVVYVRSGKDAGKSGRVVKVIRRLSRVVVEGVNLAKRHLRPGELGPQGGVVPLPAPIHYSNVNLLDPTLNKPTRVSIKFNAKTGEKVRFSKKSGAIIPWPEPSVKFTTPTRAPEPGAKDTPADVAKEVTFSPRPELAKYLSRVQEGGSGGAAGSASSSSSSSSSPSIFSPVRNEDEKVPAAIRKARLSRKWRNRILRRWAAKKAKARAARELEAFIVKTNTELNAAARASRAAGGGGGAAAAAGAGAGGAGAGEQLR